MDNLTRGDVMSEKLKRVLLLVLFISLLLGNYDLRTIQSNDNTFYMTDNKSYNAEDTVYKLDFEESSLTSYKSEPGWKFTNEGNGVIENGKLKCKSGKSFDIRSEFKLGDEYGVTNAPIEFEMLMTKGTVSVGTKLISTVSVVDTGIWFHISPNDVKVTIGGTEAVEKITHGMSLDVERKYRITSSGSRTRLYISEGDDFIKVAEVYLDADNIFSISDKDGNLVGEKVENSRTPYTGLWKMTIDRLDGHIDNLTYTNTVVTQVFPDREQRPVDYSTWVATDDLGRVTPMQDETRAFQEDKYVGLFYFFTGNAHRESQIVDVTKEYLARGIDGLKALLPTVPGIYWAEPYFGYYLNSDTWVIRKHVQMFEAAGIDFIFLDVSNGETFDEAVTVLLDTLLQIRKEGGQTPEIAFMCGDMPHILVHDLRIIYNLVYTKPEYEELFFKWEGKPLILGNNDIPGGEKWTVSHETIGQYPEDRFWSSLSTEDREYFESGQYEQDLSNFTVRKSWAWQSRKYDNDKDYSGYWDYLDDSPQAPGRSFKGDVEQVPVSIAILAHLGKGRSMTDNNPNYGNNKEDFEFTLGTAQYGYHFAEQFERALEIDPKVIMITGWNEWVAGRQSNSFADMKTGHTTTPYYHFVDQFNPEFSRDAEPMKLRDGVGYGDAYYYQMVSYIRKFKGMPPLPGSPWKNVVSFDVSISDGENRMQDVDKKIMSQWDKVKTTYMDTINDIMFRNSPSYGLMTTYVNATGRNDIEYAKVTQDDKYMYFLAKTVSGIVTEDEENWMNLFIDIDQNHETGWEGYDFVINRSRDGKTVSVEKFVNNGWEFETVGTADYLMGSDNLTIRVSKELLGITGNEPEFDFKWADNSTITGNVMQFMDLGDAAPDSRFNFRFTTEGVVPVDDEKDELPETLIYIAIASAIVVVAIVVVILIIVKKRKKA